MRVPTQNTFRNGYGQSNPSNRHEVHSQKYADPDRLRTPETSVASEQFHAHSPETSVCFQGVEGGYFRGARRRGAVTSTFERMSTVVFSRQTIANALSALTVTPQTGSCYAGYPDTRLDRLAAVVWARRLESSRALLKVSVEIEPAKALTVNSAQHVCRPPLMSSTNICEWSAYMPGGNGWKATRMDHSRRSVSCFKEFATWLGSWSDLFFGRDTEIRIFNEGCARCARRRRFCVSRRYADLTLSNARFA